MEWQIVLVASADPDEKEAELLQSVKWLTE